MSGHAFEKKIQHNAKAQHVFCHRIKTRMSGFANDNEPGDFIIAGKGSTILVEAKSTQENSFAFSLIRPNQYLGMLEASSHETVYGGLLIEMRKFNQIFYLPAEELQKHMVAGKKSLDLTNLEEYAIVYRGGMIDLNQLLESIEGRHNGKR